MSFIAYDLFLLTLFIVFTSLFLYIKRKNLKKEGLLFLYKASWGIKLINYVGNKYHRTLKLMSYVSIGIGYILMAVMLYLLGKIVYLYVAFPSVVRAIKVPPIMPLIPYLPEVFKLDFLPPFYFTYWIVILAIIAITHEFAHGIFAAYNKIKIKSTGFGFFPYFLPVFLAAFVELDEEKMAKKSKFSQMAILSAGTFANVLTGVFFFAILWIFFSAAFIPSGIQFDSYSYSIVGIGNISMINNISLNNPSYDEILSLTNETGFNKIQSNNKKYVAEKNFLEKQKDNQGLIILYDDAPAINSELRGAIIEINNVKVSSLKNFKEELIKHSIGDTIKIKTKTEEGSVKEYEIKLKENPNQKGSPWIGIGFIDQTRSGVMGKLYNVLSSFKKQHVYYEPKFDGISWFTYNLLWWLILISFSVALVNMLPVGIFDGGRFFYLTILGITGSKKTAEKSFAFMTYLFLFLLLVIMVFWALSFF